MELTPQGMSVGAADGGSLLDDWTKRAGMWLIKYTNGFIKFSKLHNFHFTLLIPSTPTQCAEKF